MFNRTLIFSSAISAFVLLFLQFSYSFIHHFSLLQDEKVYASLSKQPLLTTAFGFELVLFFLIAYFIHFVFSWGVLVYCSIIKKTDNVSPFLKNCLVYLSVLFVFFYVNEILFPRSIFAVFSNSILGLGIWLVAPAALTLIFVDYEKVFCKIKKNHKKLKGITLNTKLFILSLTALIFIYSAYSSEPTPLPDRQNIVIFSVDSLRSDQINTESPQLSHLPFISRQLQTSHNFVHAYTPLARTFPSWMSVLTGLTPLNHKAEFNLTDPLRFQGVATVADYLKNENYKTVFASDERRFANITHNLGFDYVLGPDFGVADFILGTFSDFPLLNMMTQVSSSHVLLPYTTLNRAASSTYDPQVFTRYLNKAMFQVQSQLKDEMLFIAIHLCLPHHPFEMRNSDSSKSGEEKYYDMLKEADKQVEALYSAFSEYGIINSESIQVFMSDHGESLTSDNHLFVQSGGEVRNISGFGHGTDATEIKQHHVVLGFQSSELGSKTDRRLASLTDVSPSLFSLLDSPKSSFLPVDGINLFSEKIDKTRWLKFETGFNVDAIRGSHLDQSEILAQGAYAYRVTKDGKVVIKEELYDELLTHKHYSWWDGENMLYKINEQWMNKNWENKTITEISKPDFILEP